MLRESLQLSLEQPAWLAALLALPLVYAATWRSLTGLPLRRQLLYLALRSLVVLALALALARPLVSGLPRPVHVVFLIDASASVAASSRQAAEEFVGRAKRARQDGRGTVIYFAANAVVDDGVFDTKDVDRSATDLAAALEKARTIAPPDAVPHAVLLSDGVPTQGDTERAVDAAQNAGVTVSTVPLASCEPEVYVADLRAPSAVREGEAFDVDVTLRSTHDDEGSVELTGQSGRVESQRVHVKKDETRVRFHPTIDRGPMRTLTVRINGFRDTLAENNSAEAVVAVRPRPRVLLVENRPAAAEHLAKALRAGAMVVESEKPQELPETADKLVRFDAVVLINVPAAAIRRGQMAAVKDYVRQGGGLVTVGGDQAFTPGGYRNTVLEDVLPLESQPSRKAARRSLAIVLVVDRSLSMEEGGAIELARDAMRRAVQLLQPEDQLGVLAFDEETRWASPIEPVGDKATVLARIASITAGGRTDIAPALQKAYLALREALAAQKHMIVLTDGISHPADFEGLAERIAREGITISTVALGKEASQPLLEDLARIGKGRYYACDSAQAVPNVFALETASATRLGIREEPFFARQAEQGEIFIDRESLGSLDLNAAPSLLGYVETRPRPEAHVVLTSVASDPLLAWFHSGKGTSIAFTSDAENRWAAAWLAWPGFGRFWTQVVRRALRSENSEAAISPGSPRSPGSQALLGNPLSRSSASRFYPDEFRIRPTDCDRLRRIAERTGGVCRIEPEAVWTVPSPGSLPPVPVRYYLLLAAAALFVLDAAARRFI